MAATRLVRAAALSARSKAAAPQHVVLLLLLAILHAELAPQRLTLPAGGFRKGKERSALPGEMALHMGTPGMRFTQQQHMHS